VPYYVPNNGNKGGVLVPLARDRLIHHQQRSVPLRRDGLLRPHQHHVSEPPCR